MKKWRNYFDCKEIVTAGGPRRERECAKDVKMLARFLLRGRGQLKHREQLSQLWRTDVRRAATYFFSTSSRYGLSPHNSAFLT